MREGRGDGKNRDKELNKGRRNKQKRMALAERERRPYGRAPPSPKKGIEANGRYNMRERRR